MSAPTVEEEGFAWVQEAIGHISSQQEPLIREALAENAAGVHALIAKITSDQNVRSPIAVLIHNLRDGKHRAQAARKQPTPKPNTNLQRAHGYFIAKMTDLAHTNWDDDERVEYALDYALDHCGAQSNELFALEETLRNELGAPAWIPTPAAPTPPRYPAKETPHTSLMQKAHHRWATQTPSQLEEIRDTQLGKLDADERTRLTHQINTELKQRKEER